MQLFKISFIGILIWVTISDTLERPAPAPKTQAEIEAENAKLFQELADQFLEEFYPTPEQKAAKAKMQREKMKGEQERKEKEIAEKERKIAEQKRAEAKKREQEQQSRAELEMAIIRQRLQNLMDKAFLSFKDEMPLALVYLCSETLHELYKTIDRIQTGEESEELKRRYGVGLNVFFELQAKIRNQLLKEIEKREKNSPSSFKSLLLTDSSSTFNFLTFPELQNAVKAIDLLMADRLQQECWIAELAKPSIKNVRELETLLNALKNNLQKTIDIVDKMAHQDMEKAAAENKKELSESALMREAAREQKVQEDIKKLEELKRRFPKFFENIPAELQLQFLNEYETIYARIESIEQVLEKLYKNPESRIIAQRLIALGSALNLPGYSHAGYVYFNNRPQEDREVMVLPKYIDKQGKLGWARDPEEIKKIQKEVDEAAQNLVDTYKIHLMPADSYDQIQILLAIEKALKTNSQLSKAIKKFKIVVNPYQQKDELTGQPIIFPKVVIYAFGKQNAQTILDEVYKQLENKMPGLNIRPRYNAKVTDLIWIAQGDGDYKGDRYASYYENPFAQNGRIYYRKDITGKDQYYHLVHPGIKKEIVS